MLNEKLRQTIRERKARHQKAMLELMELYCLKRPRQDKTGLTFTEEEQHENRAILTGLDILQIHADKRAHDVIAASWGISEKAVQFLKLGDVHG